MRRLLPAAMLLLAAAAAGCGGNEALPAGSVSRAPDANLTGSAAPAAATINSLLYVLDRGTLPPAIDEYRTGGGKPLRTIYSGKRDPGAFAIDAAGTFYAANYLGVTFDVTEYAAGSTRVARTIVRGIGQPAALALDGTNDLFVLDAGGPIVKYRPGAVVPSFATYAGICDGDAPAVLTVDRFGTAYVASRCGSGARATSKVVAYDGGGRVTSHIDLANTEFPVAMTTDAAGRLYIQFFDLAASGRLGIVEYDRGATTPVHTFDYGPVPSAGTSGGPPVIDPSTGDLYTDFGICTSKTGGPPWTCFSFLYVYGREATVAKRRIAAPPGRVIDSPTFDSAGNLYTEIAIPPPSVTAIVRTYPKGSTQGHDVLSGPNLALLFAGPGAVATGGAAWHVAGSPATAFRARSARIGGATLPRFDVDPARTVLP
jgi:hypothetical protein